MNVEKTLAEVAGKHGKVISETIDQKLADLPIPLANCIYDKLHVHIPTVSSFEDAKAQCEAEMKAQPITETTFNKWLKDSANPQLAEFESRLAEIEKKLRIKTTSKSEPMIGSPLKAKR